MVYSAHVLSAIQSHEMDILATIRLLVKTSFPILFSQMFSTSNKAGNFGCLLTAFPMGGYEAVSRRRRADELVPFRPILYL